MPYLPILVKMLTQQHHAILTVWCIFLYKKKDIGKNGMISGINTGLEKCPHGFID